MFTLIIQPRLPSPIHLNRACSCALTGRSLSIEYMSHYHAILKTIIAAILSFLLTQEIPAYKRIQNNLLFPPYLDKSISKINTLLYLAFRGTTAHVILMLMLIRLRV